MLEFDDLDKKIINHFSSGIYSYDDMAKTFGVTRGTIYRRVDRLEKEKIIEKKIMGLPNFGKLNLSSIILGMECVNPALTEKALEFVKEMPHVKLLWKTYGTYDWVAVLSCEVGCEGKTIN